MEKEIREFEFRNEAGEDEAMILEGHAAVFDERSQNLGGFVEVIKPGAFKNAILAKQDVRMLVDHDPSRIVARTKANTLTLQEDKVGLKVRADVAPTTVGKDLMISVGRKDISQMSFAFSVRPKRYTQHCSP